jgi:hypothetical protein
MHIGMIAENPFMLSLLKHVPLFFNSLLNIKLLNLEPSNMQAHCPRLERFAPRPLFCE